MGPPLKLLDDSSDEEPESEFTINKNYAGSYDIWRNKEELQKLKALSKEVGSSSSESEEEEEPEIEKDFLKTLSLLKSRDPRIYDENTKFFKEEDVPKKPKVKKEKPMFMKDYERKIVLEQNGMFVDEEDEDNEHLPQRQLLTNKEEAEIKKRFQEAVPDSDDGEEEDLFQVRTKTKAEEEKEEADYKQWLETEKDMLFLNKYWKDPKISEDEKFLRDYILNKRYLADDKPGEIPMYDEITGDIDLLNEDEKYLEKQEMFEHKYNFRFEEPDEEFIKSYPRTIGDSLRRENSKRKQKREEYTERKKKEKEQKKEELKRLKALKRKEIEEKFLKLKEASGQDELNLDESDIESDFDPDKHDQKMREMFNDDYYNVEEEQKPEFEFDEEIDDENWDRWTREQMNHSQNTVDESEGGSTSEEEEDDAKNNFRSQFEQEMIDSTTSNKKKRGRKKSLFAKILSQPKPLYDPSGKSFDEYVDEYYKLDYEDIVGDMPVRFKYRKVVPNDFGLTVDEILAAQDKELNRWCSVKKTCQYRDDRDEIYDVQAFQKKAQNIETKKKILVSVYTPPEEKDSQANADNSNEAVAKPKRKKKRSKKKKNTVNPDTVEEDVNSVQTNPLSSDNTGTNTFPESSEATNQLKRKKKKKKSSTNMQGENSQPDSFANDNGLIEEDMQQNTFVHEPNHENVETETNQNLVTSSKKKKNKPKTLDENDSILNNEASIESDEMNEDNIKNSKKKKRKKSQFMEGNDSTVDPESELEKNENVISNKKKRKRESSEKESSGFAEYNEDDDDDEAEVKNTQNVTKKKKMQHSFDETDLSSAKQPKNRKSDSSFSQQNATKSIYSENVEENGSNRKKNKHKNNRQSFGTQQSQKQNFYSQKFKFNKKQNDTDSVQIVDNSGKKIISSNTRLSAFEINPKKFKNRMIYGKKQT